MLQELYSFSVLSYVVPKIPPCEGSWQLAVDSDLYLRSLDSTKRDGCFIYYHKCLIFQFFLMVSRNTGTCSLVQCFSTGGKWRLIVFLKLL